MANILDIRRRIRSVRNTRQITKAMQMVSAAKLRRAQERALAARPYAQMLVNVLKSLVSRAEIYDPATGDAVNPLLVRRPENTALLIVVSGEKGLAGAFNSNILKAAAKFIATKTGKNIEVLALGRKSRDYFRRRYPLAPESGDSRGGPIQIAAEYAGLMNRAQFHSAREITEKVVQLYTEGRVDSVYIVYNEFKSVLTQRLVVDDVLPIEKIGEQVREMTEEATEEERKRRIEAAKHAGVGMRPADTAEMDAKAAAFATAPVDYIYEQKPAELFRNLLPRYISVQLFRAMLESEAAEHAARMTAMDSATSNASDMIDALTLAMNRARQAKITKEIIEIVSGAAAQ
ncbi:MAG TPA: ATP synthase F1 subunit gamma [Verrucomicrobiae bacterium]|jgi:F-type H+-transporting ATPase subunit gamma|nr:ATP synthase F1 subunit gamma [Verrucomicrobiae bacterium]